MVAGTWMLPSVLMEGARAARSTVLAATIGYVVAACASRPSAPFPRVVLSPIQYSPTEISAEARAECGIAESVAGQLPSEAAGRGVSVSTAQGDDTAIAGGLTVEITRIATAPGNGFGGRFVVSELTVHARLRRADGSQAETLETCSAGLGPFYARWTACSRFEACADDVAKELAKWLAAEVQPEAPKEH